MKTFKSDINSMSREEILALPPGKWSDSELLKWIKQEDDDRDAALMEVILRSPEMNDFIDYTELYFDLINFYQRNNDASALLYWAIAMFAFEEQHGLLINRPGNYINVAEEFTIAGDLEAGLGLFTHLLLVDPANAYIYNGMAFALQKAGLYSLLVEVMNRALEVTSNFDPDEMHEQLTELRSEALDKEPDDGGRIEEISANTLDSLRKALSTSLPEQLNEISDYPYLLQVHILSQSQIENETDAYESIIAEGRLWIPDLIRVLFDEDLFATPAPRRALELLRRLRTDHSELDALANILDRDLEEGWQESLFSDKFGKIGGYTEAELEAFALNTTYNTDLRSEALNALIDRVEACSALRPQVVSLLRRLMTRPEAYQAEEEQFVSYIISDAFDMGAEELYPEIRKAFEEDRVSPGVIGLEEVQEEFGLPVDRAPKIPQDCLELLLRCAVCNRERYHISHHVLLDMSAIKNEGESERGAFILDHEIICPKCGAVDRYKVSTSSYVMLLGESLVDFVIDKDTGKRMPRFHPKVYHFGAMIAGKNMHPLDGLDYYRTQILINPDDAQLHMKMGNLLRSITRYESALEAYRKANVLAPDDAEIVFVRATAEHDFGDLSSARELYEKAVQLLSGNLQAIAEDDNLQGALAGLQDLIKGRPSPWEYQIRNSFDEVLLPPRRDFTLSKSASKKKGKGRRRHKKKS